MSKSMKEKYMEKPYLIFEVSEIENLTHALKMYFSWQDDDDRMSVHVKQCKRYHKGHFGGQLATKYYKVIVVPRHKVKIQLV